MQGSRRRSTTTQWSGRPIWAAWLSVAWFSVTPSVLWAAARPVAPASWRGYHRYLHRKPEVKGSRSEGDVRLHWCIFSASSSVCSFFLSTKTGCMGSIRVCTTLTPLTMCRVSHCYWNRQMYTPVSKTTPHNIAEHRTAKKHLTKQHHTAKDNTIKHQSLSALAALTQHPHLLTHFSTKLVIRAEQV